MNKKTLSNYILAFDEINALTAVSYNTASETTEDQTVQVSQIADDILSLLINAYRKGVQAASEMLAYDLTVDVRSMDEVIYLVIDGKTFEDRVADHVLSGDLQGLQTLAESEFHRVYNAAVLDGGHQYQSSVGYGVTKNWYTVMDERCGKRIVIWKVLRCLWTKSFGLLTGIMQHIPEGSLRLRIT